jgi:hypothetical protein
MTQNVRRQKESTILLGRGDVGGRIREESEDSRRGVTLVRVREKRHDVVAPGELRLVKEGEKHGNGSGRQDALREVVVHAVDVQGEHRFTDRGFERRNTRATVAERRHANRSKCGAGARGSGRPGFRGLTRGHQVQEEHREHRCPQDRSRAGAHG